MPSASRACTAEMCTNASAAPRPSPGSGRPEFTEGLKAGLDATVPAAAQLASPAIYMFCIARGDLLTTIAGTGVNGDDWLQLIPFRDLVAVVSTVSVNDFCGPVAEACLEDLAWVGPRACRHEAVVDQVMRSSPIVPARFATLFSSRDTLVAWLERHHATISDSLNRFAGHQEWAVKGRLDRQTAETRLLRAALERDRSTLAPSPGARYLGERRIRARVAQELDTWVKDMSERVATELLGHAADLRERAIVREAPMADGIGVLMNWAFLVAERRTSDFSASIRRINGELYEQGVVLEVSGPWPPYSFGPQLDLGSSA